MVEIEVIRRGKNKTSKIFSNVAEAKAYINRANRGECSFIIFSEVGCQTKDMEECQKNLDAMVELDRWSKETKATVGVDVSRVAEHWNELSDVAEAEEEEKEEPAVVDEAVADGIGFIENVVGLEYSHVDDTGWHFKNLAIPLSRGDLLSCRARMSELKCSVSLNLFNASKQTGRLMQVEKALNEAGAEVSYNGIMATVTYFGFGKKHKRQYKYLQLCRPDKLTGVVNEVRGMRDDRY